MSQTRDNHFVPQWYQKGFFELRDNQLCYLTRRHIKLGSGEIKVVNSKRWHTTAQQLYKVDLYSTFFNEIVNDDIERKLFGPIDDNGSRAIRAFLTDDQSQWHHNFQNLFTYLDAQKLRTPKGLDWIKSKYPTLSQHQLMIEMQKLRLMHCTLWTEGVRELISAENSDVKFITSDHPVTIYNHACPPESKLCEYPNDPDISLKGSQTIFPLDKNRCLILTNLEYAKDPEGVNPLEQRINPTRIRQSMVSTIDFINSRKLTASEVTQINYIIKSRAPATIAAGNEEWLSPEDQLNLNWSEIRNTLLPPANELHSYGGEIYARFEDGTTHYQDAFGRRAHQSESLQKNTDEACIGRNAPCGCGSGKKYKSCCKGVPNELRTTWKVLSIRERNLAFCNCIHDVLGLNKGKTWTDVRREISSEQISTIYQFYSTLWPRETDIYSLLPKPDGRFRGLYTGSLDVRAIGVNALPIASVFDELLIESPIINPGDVRAECSPIKSPEKFKCQALKDFLFMLELEPFIARGLVNLIPSPIEFDLELMKAMFEMARTRSKDSIGSKVSEKDRILHDRLSTEDLLNSIAMLPQEHKVRTLAKEFGIPHEHAGDIITEWEREPTSPLMLLQKFNEQESGQFLNFRMGPNYEMALFTAQVTGAVIVTDSDTRWKEFTAAQFRTLGVVNYPWREALKKLVCVPIDTTFIDTLHKSAGHFSTLRDILKSVDCMILSNNKCAKAVARIALRTTELMIQIEKNDQQPKSRIELLSPDGGISDPNVQRLLIRSSCTRYDNEVRSIYGLCVSD